MVLSRVENTTLENFSTHLYDCLSNLSNFMPFTRDLHSWRINRLESLSIRSWRGASGLKHVLSVYRHTLTWLQLGWNGSVARKQWFGGTLPVSLLSTALENFVKRDFYRGFSFPTTLLSLLPQKNNTSTHEQKLKKWLFWSKNKCLHYCWNSKMQNVVENSVPADWPLLLSISVRYLRTLTVLTLAKVSQVCGEQRTIDSSCMIFLKMKSLQLSYPVSCWLSVFYGQMICYLQVMGSVD